MIIDIMRLKTGLDEYIEIDIVYSFSKEQLVNTDILKIDNCQIKGMISNDYDDFYLNLTVIGEMILPCSVSLKPINYPIKMQIEGNIRDLLDKKDIKVENSIDIFPIIWENILMEIPLRIVCDDLSDVKTSGDGWKLITENEEEE